MKCDISKTTAPKMPKLGRGLESVALLLSQVSKDMQEPIVPMLFPILGAHVSGAHFMYPDLSWKEMSGMMGQSWANSGAGKGQLSSIVEATCRDFRGHDDEELAKLVERQKMMKTNRIETHRIVSKRMIANAHCCNFAHVKDTDRHQHHPSTHQHHRPMSQPPITNHRHSCNTSAPHCAPLASARIRAAHTNGHEREQEATRLGGEEVQTGTRLKANNIRSESRLRLKGKAIRVAFYFPQMPCGMRDLRSDAVAQLCRFRSASGERTTNLLF